MLTLFVIVSAVTAPRVRAREALHDADLRLLAMGAGGCRRSAAAGACPAVGIGARRAGARQARRDHRLHRRGARIVEANRARLERNRRLTRRDVSNVSTTMTPSGSIVTS